MVASLPLQRLRTVGAHLTATPTSAAKPPFDRLLIANRGEIACRIHRAAKALGIQTVGICTEEDADGLHRKVLDKVVMLPKGATPVAPYLDSKNIAEIGKKEGCTAVHPGYGFLSENEEFAALCEQNGITFVGPRPETIDMFGDKTKAKAIAKKAGTPVLESSPGFTDAAAVQDFVKSNNMAFPCLLKASYGGGGRGQAVVYKMEELAENFNKCSKEAEMSFGRPEVFIERYLQKARHIEVQIMGDGTRCVHLFERDCSVQLRKQKVIELAPSFGMAPELRQRICSAAVKMCESVGYRNAGTVEFLVEGELSDPKAGFYFLELNPRIQVEHTITEEITKVDLVQTQLKIAGGQTLTSLGFEQDKLQFQGVAIQVRVGLMPGGGGKVTKYGEPKGVRVETSVGQDTTAVTDYDPMIAKLVVYAADFDAAVAAARAAVTGYVVDGLKINSDFLLRLLDHEEFNNHQVHTVWVEDRKIHMPPKKAAAGSGPGVGSTFQVESPFPGQVTELKVKVGDEVPAGATLVILSAMKMLNDVTTDRPVKVLEILVAEGAQVNEGVALLKLEATGEAVVDEVVAPPSATRKAAAEGGSGPSEAVTNSWYSAGQVSEMPYDTPIFVSKAKPGDPTFQKRVEHNKALSAELDRRLGVVKKGGGDKAVNLHRSRGKHLVRERIAKIVDAGTDMLELSALAGWEMYGGGIHSGGTIAAIGVVAGRECMFIGTDATIKGGTSFPVGLKKWLRAQAVAEMNWLPCIYLIDGGGLKLDAQADGAEGEDASGRDLSYEGTLPAQFTEFGRQFNNQVRMSAKGIPQIAVVCGMCTAGGAYTPALADESIIVQGNGTVYLGGPPLVKAATGEDCDEQELGGAVMHTSKSGTCDHFAPNEDAALKQCRAVIENLAGKQPRAVLRNMAAPEEPLYDPDSMLGIIPESTKLPFDIREVIARIVDGSRFHEFKAKYGPTMVTGWAHIHGYPVGILGNNGMIFSEVAKKATHFLQICGMRGTPIVFLHNITGFIIGTKFEQGGITKDGAKMINAITNVPCPKFSIVCGGSYGAGNYAMCGPAFDPRFTFLWPNAKISVMGGEQAAGVVSIVKQNGLRRDGKKEMSDEMVEKFKRPIINAIENKNSAWHSTAGGFDDGVIDPRDTRKVLAQVISASLNAPPPTSTYGVYRM